MSNDPFSFDDPAPIASEFASADSFRGRLVLITPTDFEPDNRNDEGKLMPRFTATVTTVDGKGRVEIYAQRLPQGQYLEGPRHEGVWFSQDRIVKGLRSAWERKTSVLAKLDTFKPGKPAGKGNPWGLIAATDAEKKQAREFLANLAVSSAAEPDASDDENPFG